MGRLIDADALIERLDKRKTYEAMDGRNKAYVKGVRDAMKDVENQPTIDAIPVEWLEAQISPYRDKLRDEAKGVFNATVKAILYRWQEEQEAR